MAWLSDTNILLRMAQPAHPMHTERIYPEWLDLVVTHSVSGIDVYDARLVAAMHVYGVGNLLTFDVHDFARYPDIRIFQPKDVLRAYSQ